MTKTLRRDQAPEGRSGEPQETLPFYKHRF